jgi:hypothetical protein
MVQIGGATGQDAILFLQDLIEGYIKDEKGNDIRITYTNPKEINQIPRVVLFAEEEQMKFLSIPAIRRRWTAPFTLRIWAINVAQRYAIKQSIQARLDDLSHPDVQLAENYVYMWFESHDTTPEVRQFGQPIFKAVFTITLKYDTLTQQAGTP